ncbi:hypothetical protein FJT64_014209 [Amphibalanus amphitrite]|uniref:Uncharacterized protein n=2 Tax=Amphibalanus amphitrite TaxID=1232801 RepID=A0A6A4VAJ4_AMPAM|nr:hypothetical protein FJT64_014209 [Amphibalanus amphitrite]
MTHNRYMDLADRALEQWPALLHGLTSRQALEQVKNKIQWRVRNYKRPDPGVMGSFKRPAQATAAKKAKKSRRYENFEGYQDYLPPEPEEDMQVHRNRLRQEGLTEEEREALRDLTFADRRRHAVALSTPMKKFLHMYPMMKNHQEEYRKRLCDFLTAVQMHTECEDDDKVDSLLEYLLVDPEEIFGSAGSQTMPHFEESPNGSLTLVVEGQRVVEDVEMTRSDALLLWAASFPVYNQKPPTKTAKNALAFLSEQVFEKARGSVVVGNRALKRIQQIKQLTE